MLPALSGPATATHHAALWRAKAHALAADLAPMQAALVAAQEEMTRLEHDVVVPKETKAFAKQDEAKQDAPQIDHSEDGYSDSFKEQAAARLSTANAKLVKLEKATTSTTAQPDSSPVAWSPVLAPSEIAPDNPPSVLADALEMAVQEKTSAENELQRTLGAANTLCAQLANLVQVIARFDLKKLHKIVSSKYDPGCGKPLNDIFTEIKMLLCIDKINDRIEAHGRFNSILSSDYAKEDNSKFDPVTVTSSSANLPSDDLFSAPTKPLPTAQVKRVDLNYVIGPSSAESKTTSAVPAQATSSSFCLTPEEAAAIKQTLHNKARPNFTKPVVTELRPGIIVKVGHGTSTYEARAMEFIARYTNVPVPRVLASFDFEGYPCIVMTKIQGTTLEYALRSQCPWLNLSLVCKQLRDVVRQLRSVPLDTVLGPGASDRIAPACDAWNSKRGMLDGGPGMDFPVSDVQAFKRLVETRFCHRPAERRLLSHVNTQVKTVLCHGDLVACNIMVGEHGLTGVIDWESLGTYPPEWEIESALGSCGYRRDRAALAYSYIPPYLPCSQALPARQACTRRHSYHSADCVK